MQRKQIIPACQALLAALLFGASAPLSKLLLGAIEPVPLAAFLYLGSGCGALILSVAQRWIKGGRPAEAQLVRADAVWLVGAILAGGVAAPILLLAGLRSTPASTAALLLNFESVATTFLAAVLFRESVGRRIAAAVLTITLASLLLSWDGSSTWGFTLGPLAILAACFLWGLDNNLTRALSARDPLTIVAIKGLGAGLFSLLLVPISGSHLPAAGMLLWAALLGSISYGLSIQLFVLALRELGAARSSALFGLAPFTGALFSILLFHEVPSLPFGISLLLIVAGTWLMLAEHHGHLHRHEVLVHTHRHFHQDDAHEHEDPPGTEPDGWHAHAHRHLPVDHEHAHTPDLHHRH